MSKEGLQTLVSVPERALLERAAPDHKTKWDTTDPYYSLCTSWSPRHLLVFTDQQALNGVDLANEGEEGGHQLRHMDGIQQEGNQ